jgi:hypothetical protein
VESSTNLLKDSSTRCFHASLTTSRAVRRTATDSSADFFERRPAGKVNFAWGKRPQAANIAMTFASSLSVLAAYVALAFVGAIVLSMF